MKTRGRDASETVFVSPYFDFRATSEERRATASGMKHLFVGSWRVATSFVEFDATAVHSSPPSDEPSTRYFHSDHLGSATLLTDDDGTVVEQTELYPDGAAWISRSYGPPLNGYVFTGKLFDPETGLYDFGQRFYDPNTQLWLGIDPLLLESPGVLIERTNVMSSYSYAANNSMKYVDPDGRDVYLKGGKRDISSTVKKLQKLAGNYGTISYEKNEEGNPVYNKFGNLKLTFTQSSSQEKAMAKDAGSDKSVAASLLKDAMTSSSSKILIIDATPRVIKKSDERKMDEKLNKIPLGKSNALPPGVAPILQNYGGGATIEGDTYRTRTKKAANIPSEDPEVQSVIVLNDRIIPHVDSASGSGDVRFPAYVLLGHELLGHSWVNVNGGLLIGGDYYRKGVEDDTYYFENKYLRKPNGIPLRLDSGAPPPPPLNK